MHAFIATAFINLKKRKILFFTNVVQTEGGVDAVWDAIPRISNKFGEARVHSLTVFIVSVNMVKVHLYNPLISTTQFSPTHMHHSYFSMVIKQLSTL